MSRCGTREILIHLPVDAMMRWWNWRTLGIIKMCSFISYNKYPANIIFIFSNHLKITIYNSFISNIVIHVFSKLQNLLDTSQIVYGLVIFLDFLLWNLFDGPNCFMWFDITYLVRNSNECVITCAEQHIPINIPIWILHHIIIVSGFIIRISWMTAIIEKL